MNVLQMPRMIFSFSDGWDDLIRTHPSIGRLLVSLVLPRSLLPPALIYRGVFALFSLREEFRALQMAFVIAAAGLFMWLLLMQIVLAH